MTHFPATTGIDKKRGDVVDQQRPHIYTLKRMKQPE